jgi:hypothetical protein
MTIHIMSNTILTLRIRDNLQNIFRITNKIADKTEIIFNFKYLRVNKTISALLTNISDTYFIV